MANKKISMKEISRLSGVSVATVSRVINQNGRFSKETEERVRRVIEEHNYTPDLIARGLRTNKVQTVGLIVPDITNEFFAQIILHLQRNLFHRGYSAIICNTSEAFEAEKQQIAMLRSQKISGLIYVAGADRQEVETDIPVVYIDRKPHHRREYSVFIEGNNLMGGELAARELMDRGCKRVARMVLGGGDAMHERERGCIDTLARRGLCVDPELSIPVDKVDLQNGYLATKALLDSGIPFDGIFCGGDYLAVGAVRALRESGIHIPEQVKIVGFDDISAAEICRVELTTIRQPREEYARVGAEELVRMIEGAPPEKTHYLFPMELVRRESS